MPIPDAQAQPYTSNPPHALFTGGEVQPAEVNGLARIKRRFVLSGSDADIRLTVTDQGGVNGDVT